MPSCPHAFGWAQSFVNRRWASPAFSGRKEGICWYSRSRCWMKGCWCLDMIGIMIFLLLLLKAWNPFFFFFYVFRAILLIDWWSYGKYLIPRKTYQQDIKGRFVDTNPREALQPAIHHGCELKMGACRVSALAGRVALRLGWVMEW